MKTSGLFKLDWRDFLKALLIAALTPALVLLQELAANGSLTVDYLTNRSNLQTIGMLMVGSGLAYLLKNFFTPQQEVTPLQDGVVRKVKDIVKKPE